MPLYKRIAAQIIGPTVFNDAGLAVDFRMEGDTDPNLFFLKGSTDKIGFGTATPAEKLNVIGNFQVDDAATPTKGYRFRTTGSTLDLDGSAQDLLVSNYSGAGFTGTQRQYMRYGAGGNFVTVANEWSWKLGNNVFGATQHVINSDGGVIFNESGADADTRMEGDTDDSLFFLDASTDRIGIGLNAPTEKLGVNGNIALETAGNGLQIKEGTNATMGVVTLVAGTATVSTTQALTASRIFLTAQSLGTVTIGQGLAVSARVNGTSFTILSQSAIDTSVVAWMIVNPA